MVASAFSFMFVYEVNFTFYRIDYIHEHKFSITIEASMEANCIPFSFVSVYKVNIISILWS